MLYQEKPHRRYIRKLRFVYWGFLAICMFIFVSIVVSTLGIGFSALRADVFILVVLLSILFGEIYSRLLMESYKYEITDDYVSFQGGVLVKSRRKIPFQKIVDITVTQDIFEQALGLSSLHIHTSGSSGSPEITFYGLKNSVEPEGIIKEKIMKKKRVTSPR